jgi:regulator of replication initiation timing
MLERFSRLSVFDLLVGLTEALTYWALHEVRVEAENERLEAENSALRIENHNLRRLLASLRARAAHD